MDLKLAPVTHDLVVTKLDLSLNVGTELMRQRLKQSLWFFQGEWYLDITDGVPYYIDVFVKKPDQITVESVIKQAVLETPGVTELISFDIRYDADRRNLSVKFQVKTIYGNVFYSEDLL